MPRATAIRPRRRAFTLIEVLITIAIIVVLAGLVAVNVVGVRESTKPDNAKIQMDAIESALKTFYVTFDRFPTEDEGIAVLWSKETLEVEQDAEEAKWRKFLDDPAPTDPWGAEWQYTNESDHGEDYDLWSYGPDGEDATEDDIVSWSGEGDSDFGSGMPAPAPAPSP